MTSKFVIWSQTQLFVREIILSLYWSFRAIFQAEWSNMLQELRKKLKLSIFLKMTPIDLEGPWIKTDSADVLSYQIYINAEIFMTKAYIIWVI